MTRFVTVARLAEVPPGSLRRVDVGDTPVVLANVDGSVYAVQADCTHRGGPLHEGRLEGAGLQCPWHGGLFDVTTGEVIGPPPEDDLRTFEVRVENDAIAVRV